MFCNEKLIWVRGTVTSAWETTIRKVSPGSTDCGMAHRGLGCDEVVLHGSRPEERLAVEGVVRHRVDVVGWHDGRGSGGGVHEHRYQGLRNRSTVLPSWPPPLSPQHHTSVPVTTAQLWVRPAEISVTPVRPATDTGVGELTRVPLPSPPFEFKPQHFAVPPPITAHAWNAPRDSWVTPASACTGTGTSDPVVVPLPSCPNALLPQHDVVPPTLAHEWNEPAWRVDAVGIPCGAIGTTESTFVPVPSWPWRVVAPAAGRRCGRQRARVQAADRDRRDRRDPGDHHRCERVGRRAVAELALGVVAPAPHDTGDVQRAAVSEPGAELDDVGQAGDLDRARSVGRGAVADLAVGVAAPAEHGTQADGARMGEAGGDRGGVRHAGHEPRRRGVHEGADAELAPGVLAPTGDLSDSGRRRTSASRPPRRASGVVERPGPLTSYTPRRPARPPPGSRR